LWQVIGIFSGVGAAGISASVLTTILPNTLEDLIALGVCSAGGYTLFTYEAPCRFEFLYAYGVMLLVGILSFRYTFLTLGFSVELDCFRKFLNTVKRIFPRIHREVSL